MIFIKKVHLIINDFIIETEGEIKNNCLLFLYNNINYEFDFQNLIFKRENGEFINLLNFKDKYCDYLLKTTNTKLHIDLLIKVLQLNKNKVIIGYQINEENFNFSLSYLN